jgi:hypothetical protein
LARFVETAPTFPDGGGPGPWSNIWERGDREVVVGAIVIT